jgi:hypothetical protein
MASSVEEIRAKMAKDSNKKPEDFAYITEDLLREMEANAKRFSPEVGKNTYYGCNLYIGDEGYWYWKSSPNDPCGTANSWFWPPV